MPCYDPRGSVTEIIRDDPKTLAKLRKLEAVLCGILTEREHPKYGPGNHVKGDVNTFLDTINWAEVGVSKEWVLKWWKQHQLRDQLLKSAQRAIRK